MYKIGNKLIEEYTADDEEPDCGRCDHICDSEEWCTEHCGAEHAWIGYRRTEEEIIIEE